MSDVVQRPRIFTVASSAAPIYVTDAEPRCWRCDRKLALVVTRPWRLQCSRCHALNTSPPA